MLSSERPLRQLSASARLGRLRRLAQNRRQLAFRDQLHRRIEARQQGLGRVLDRGEPGAGLARAGDGHGECGLATRPLARDVGAHARDVLADRDEHAAARLGPGVGRQQSLACARVEQQTLERGEPLHRDAAACEGLRVERFAAREQLAQVPPGGVARIGPEVDALAAHEQLDRPEAHVLDVLPRIVRAGVGGFQRVDASGIGRVAERHSRDAQRLARFRELRIAGDDVMLNQRLVDAPVGGIVECGVRGRHRAQSKRAHDVATTRAETLSTVRLPTV